MTSWRAFDWQDGPAPDPLCTHGGSGTRLDCRIEGEDFARGPVAPTGELVVCAYNVERGLRIDEQLRAFTSDPGMPAPDLLLLSEADRGCTRTGDRNVAREYARALGMRYVYGVEFVELPRIWGPGGGRIRRPCEHGNAILTHHQLGNVRVIRHRRTRSWHSRVQRTLRIGQPRLGGRIAVAADVRVGALLLRVYSVHFESGGGTARTDRSSYRLAQAHELVDDAAGVAHGVIVGGDMNVLGHARSDGGVRVVDPTIGAFLDAGHVDAHESLPHRDRITTDTGQAIDLIVGRGVTFTDAGVAPRRVWAGLSDHLPVWARIDLEGRDA